MPYDQNDDAIIRNGTLRQWLSYRVKPHGIHGWWIVAAVALIAFAVGKFA